MTDDAELLRQYTGASSESAFAELVTRHLPLVFSAALRHSNGDEHLAKDVAQAVFTELARKAGLLSRHEVLAAWLYTTTRFIAVKTIRGNCRRRAREVAAVAMQESPTNLTPEPDWHELSLILDEAMSKLNRADKTAVLLRFFESKGLKAVGAALGIGEDAARMRVNRALERLRDLFARRGINSTAAAIATSLSAHAVQTAPSGLAAALSASALNAAASTAAGTTLTTSLYLLTTKLKIGLLIVAAAIATMTLVHHRKALQSLRVQNSELQAQLTSAQQSPVPTPSPSALVTIAPTELAQLEKDRMSLLRLRNEATQLRQQLAQFKAASDARVSRQAVPNPTAPTEVMDVVRNDTPIETYDHLLLYGALWYSNVTVSQILPNLPGLTGAKVEVENGVMTAPGLVTFAVPAGATRSEAALLVEQALQDQAGLVVIHPDTNHIVVRLKAP